METYKITMEIDGEERTTRWSGYGEASAIAQAMLSFALDGARSLRVIEIA